MIIAGVAAFCVLILILAFLVPRLSRHPERGGQKILGTGGRTAGKAEYVQYEAMPAARQGTIWITKPIDQYPRDTP